MTTPPASRTPELYALLIGIDYYFPNRLPDGGYYPSLGGCVRDVLHVETYLRDRLGLPDDHLIKLTISTFSGPYPPEPPEQWPTYDNMVEAFKRIGELAASGDQIYIHYAGHGGRATTAYAELKGQNGLDEVLVPTGIGNPEENYLRDVELHYLLTALVNKGLLLTVVLDSCHSGGATRGIGGAVRRGIASIDRTPRPISSLVAPPLALVAAWQHSSNATRALQSASGWLQEPQGYTLLAACRANESAYEYPYDGEENNGALTYWLLDALRDAGPATTYKTIYDHILAKVHGQFEQQTPMLQGEGNRAVFDSAQIPPVYAVPVLAVDEAGRIRLNAGSAHGLTPGARFMIYPSATVDLTDAAQALAIVEVCTVNAVDCWAEVIERRGQATLEAGAQAVLQRSNDVRLQHTVAVVIDDAALRNQIGDAIAADGKGFVAVAPAGAPADFQVALSGDGSFELWDTAGIAIPNLRPPIQISDPKAVQRVVARLVHLAKYRNVQTLTAGGATPAGLKLELAGATGGPTAGPTAGAGLPAQFRPGDKVILRITNTQSPDPIDLNNRDLILNITVLDLASDWSIQQIYPARAGAFEPLQPGATIPLEFDAYLPDGYTESRDIVKVFATRATTQFRWLELPPLDRPDQHSPTLRGLIVDPLEQLLAQITGDAAPTRAIRLSDAAGAELGWSVAQIELRVQAEA